MSELSTTTSRSGSAARRPRLTLAAKPLLSSPSTTSMPWIAPQRGDVLGAARVVGDDDARHVLRHSLADARDERRDAIGVAVARDHDVDRLAMLAVPSQRAAVGVVRRVRAQTQPMAERREAQRQRERAEQQRAPAEVVVGQIDAPAQPRERSAELAVERASRRSTAGRAIGGRVSVLALWRRSRCGLVLCRSAARRRRAPATRSSLAPPARDGVARPAGSRSAREPSSAPARRTTW